MKILLNIWRFILSLFGIRTKTDEPDKPVEPKPDEPKPYLKVTPKKLNIQ
jgi:hypothetical protein